MQRFLHHFTNLYLIWLIIAVALALAKPPAFSWFNGPWIVWALSIVMLGMGLTLTVDDFRRLFQMPGSLALGFLAHYTIMPLTGWALARALKLEPGFAIGLVLVASCPSGTASNVVSFLARANVALAVAVTLTSTMLAFVMTPLWCRVLAGQYVEVDAVGLCRSTLQVIVVPLLLGVFCNWRFPRIVARIAQFGPVVSVIAIVFITGGVVSTNAAAVRANFGTLVLATLLLHLLGFGLGYAVARVLRYPIIVARTVSIEVGMQNGGMAAMLAKNHFPMHPFASVPAAFSAVIQNLVGSVVAAWWRSRPVEPVGQTEPEANPKKAPAAH